jgi:predicted enzyme related to lactoylglutathione lyase
MFKKLRTIIYHVDDLARAREWYSRVTGITPYFEETFYVGFDISGYELGLDPDMSDIAAGEHSIAYWSVDNIEDAVDTLTKNGAMVVSDINNVGEGIRVAIVKDPFGNCIGLIEEN